MEDRKWFVELIQNDGTWKPDSIHRTYAEAKRRVADSAHILGRSAKLTFDSGVGCRISKVESPERLASDRRGRFVVLIHVGRFGWCNLWGDGYYYDNLRIATCVVSYYTAKDYTLIRMVDLESGRIIFDGTSPKKCVNWKTEGF